MKKEDLPLDDSEDLFKDMSFSLYIEKGKGKLPHKSKNITIPQAKGRVERKSEEETLTWEEQEPTSAFSPPDPGPFSSQHSRIKEKWSADNSTDRCKACGVLFTFYRRRHHCYYDGDLYCGSCASYWEKIPKVIKKIPTRSGKEEPIDYNTPIRLCKKCWVEFTDIFKLEKLFLLFSLMKLTLQDFKTISKVCKQWAMIGSFYLSKFRQIQYKIPKHPYDDWEKRALWNNRKLLKGHSLWETHVIRSTASKPNKFWKAVYLYYGDQSSPLPAEKNGRECWNRMCNRYCTRKLDEEKAILLLDVLHIGSPSANTVAKKVIESFERIDVRHFERVYLPYCLFKLCQTNNRILKEFILKKCKEDLRVANATYLFLKDSKNTSLWVELLETLDPETHKTLVKVDNFVELVRENEILSGKIVSPVEPQLGEQVVFSDRISVKESATRPIFIPCDGSSILFKRDDIRKDWTIMPVIRLMEKILKDNGYGVDLVTYNTQPIGETEGFISIVENSETLYTIQEKLKISLINYLLKNNPKVSVSDLRGRFTMSCAVYTTITYLLSISDRNTENLMVTKDGSFFHIDYSQILGHNLKPFKPSCTRITDEMVEALGGKESEEYAEFISLCLEINDILRRHFNTFVCLLSPIPTFKTDSPTCPRLDEDVMFEALVKRFCPGETYEVAARAFKIKIDESSESSTFSRDKVLDFFHKHNKEKSVQNALYTTYSGTKNVLSTMYNYLYSLT